jgi:hypothetical protein
MSLSANRYSTELGAFIFRAEFPSTKAKTIQSVLSRKAKWAEVLAVQTCAHLIVTKRIFYIA